MYVKQSAGYVKTAQPPESGCRDAMSVNPCKHLKSLEGEKVADLERLLAQVVRKHTDKLQIDRRIPEGLSKGFLQSIASYQRTAPTLLTQSAQQASQTHPESPGLALVDFHGDLLSQTDRLHNIQVVHGAILQQYLSILEERPEESYLFISEKGDHTCEQCERLHGRLFGKEDLARGGMIPPLHPNCRCSLVALDRTGLRQYNSPNREDMLLRLQRALDGLGGAGIFILDPRFVSFGINPDALSRLDPRAEMPILGLDPKLQGVYRELFRLMEEMGNNAEAALGELGGDATAAFSKILHSSLTLLEAFFQRGRDLFAHAAELAEENILLGTLRFADATVFGLASAVLSELSRRGAAFFNEPGVLTGANLLTLGLVDAIYGVFNPEEHWSPGHLADILGAAGILSLFGLARSTLHSAFSSADEFLRSALDDLARGRASGLTRRQIDDILRMQRGQRPDPSTYLSSSYINSHLSQFRGGGTKIMKTVPNGTIGASSGTFIMPSSLADDLIRQAAGDISKLEELLGFPTGYLGNQPIRIDIPNPTGLRMPSGNEAGANPQWIPGGYTNGGIMEAVIDPVNVGDYIVRTID